MNIFVFKNRRVQVVVYMPIDLYEAMKRYLEDLQKKNPEFKANMSRYIVSLVKEDLKKKGYLKE
jgi:hypothetical protein